MARTYVVTGSASGIGAATRDLLEANGARVIGIDLRDAEVVADLADSATRATLGTAVREHVDAIDAVIACAAVRGSENAFPPGPIIAINYFGAVATLEQLHSLLLGSSAPRVAVIASIAVLDGWQPEVVDACLANDEQLAIELSETSAGAYASSKRALARYVRRSAPSEMWAGAGIPVNSVSPGLIETPMTAGRLADPEKRRALLDRNPQPLGIGRPEQVAALLVWLTSTSNGFVTGQNVFVDGGREATERGDDTL